MQGFLNVDKPRGMTSFDVVRKIKKIIPRGIKIGHLGTLDPMAGGVLPLAIGKATRVIPYVEDERKVYIAQFTLGAVSDTQDAWGRVDYTGKKDFRAERLEGILQEFTGRIKQIPPMYSAVHHQGKRLYELAREGITVAREEREIVIHSLEILEINRDAELPVIKIKVDCSRGTYVRTLGHDIGVKLGTGALLSGLVRICSGRFNIEQASPLEKILQDQTSINHYLWPLDYPLTHLPAIQIDSREDLQAIMNGQAVAIKARLPQGLIRVYSPENSLVALARSNHEGAGMIKAERVFNKGA
ncbi:tRNA pseudouridine(55) synthase TruB [Syntrophomonas curvata]